MLKGRVVFFATNNIHKFNEARSILAKLDVLSESFNLSTNKGRLAMSQAIDALGHETRDLLITIPE